MVIIPPVVRVLRLLIGLAVLLSLAISVIASQPALEGMSDHTVSGGLTLLAGIGVVGMLLGLCGLLRRDEEAQRGEEALRSPQPTVIENGSDGDGTYRPLPLPQPQPPASGPSVRPAFPPDSQCDCEMPPDAQALQLFDRLKTEIACHNWRKARYTARRLIESCPDHPKALATRAQRKLIEENAEIEERKEIELRIGQLLKSHRYGEGIHMAERLIKQYPASPQAKAAQQWLPRLRARLAAREFALS